MPQVFHVALLILVWAQTSSAGSIRVQLSDYDKDSWKGVLRRVAPAWVQEEFEDVRVTSAAENGFQLPKSGFAKIEIGKHGRKTVVANTPTDALNAINTYLRTECLSQVSWSNSSFSSGCRKHSNDVINFESKQIRYFGNMCTFSYSFVWWEWPQWERFIDWIALNGFNTVLMPLGQEAIWRDIFMGLGVERDELNEYFTSQAYLAWHRMGNLKAYGGGLSDAQMLNDLNLAKRIINRLLELGITPILPTFAGFVPDQLEKLFPSSKFTRLPCWNNFTSETSCLLSVSPFDPLFQKIGSLFLRHQKKMFGGDITNLYSADPFNEILPSDSAKFDAKFVKQTAQAIMNSCRKVDKNCIWVLQSWSFTYDEWPSWAIKSFLSAVPIGNLLILDLYSEVVPAWQSTSSFHGHNYIWCMLHNFGGSRELRGNLQKVDKGYQLALMKGGSNLIGAGLTMEAIDQNYVVYQFMIDRMWSSEPLPLNTWIKSYSESRYSADFKVSHKFWTLLAFSFYNQPEKWGNPRFSVFLYHRPAFGKKIEYWFPVEETFGHLQSLIPSLIHVLGDHPLFKEDLNDVMRAITQFEVGNDAALTLTEAFLMEDKQQIGSTCENLMDMFLKLESYSNRNMQHWIEDSKSIAATSEERQVFPATAADILTVWGPEGQNLDYAHREWEGLLSGYYGRRWQYFCDWILEHDFFNHTEFSASVFRDVERPYSVSNL